MPIIRCMIMVSSKPRVVISATLAPRRSMKALVATVVPWAIRSIRSSSAARSVRSFCAAAVRAASKPSCNRPGVDGDLVVVTEPSSPITTTSVKVPPISMPTELMVLLVFPGAYPEYRLLGRHHFRMRLQLRMDTGPFLGAVTVNFHYGFDPGCIIQSAGLKHGDSIHY